MNTENMKFIPLVLGMTSFVYDELNKRWVVWDEDAREPGTDPTMYTFPYREGAQPEGIFVRGGSVVRVQYAGE